MPEQNNATGTEQAAAERYQEAEERLGDSGNVKPQAAEAGLDAARGADPDKAARPHGAPSAPSLPAGDQH